MSYQKLVLRTTVLLITVFVIYNVALWISRIGEVPVAVRAIPSDSKISLNDKEIKPGTYYLSEGEYTFSAEREHFSQDKKTITVAKETETVVLVPGINSPEAEQYFEDNTDEAVERESFFGEEITKRSERIQEKYPIVNSLPVSELTGPFSIDYGTEEDNPEEIFLIVNNSSPKGRVAALKWLRQNGQDPTDLKIIFSDFVNPLESGEEHYH